MDAIGPDSVAPKDDLQEDLQAALAEIDKVSGENPAAVGALSDDLAESDSSAVPDIPPPPPPESVESESAEMSEAPTAHPDATDVAGETDDALPTPIEPPDQTDAAARETDEKSTETLTANDEAAPHHEPPPPGQHAPVEGEQLATAATEIEQPSGEQPDIVATLDNGDEAADDDALDSDSPAAGPETSPNAESRLTDDELPALSSGIEDNIADAKPAPSEETVGVGNPSGTSAETERTEAVSPASTNDESDGGDAPVEPRSASKKFRFQVGKKPAKQRTAAPRPPAQPERRREAVRAVQPTTSRGKRLFRVVDQALDTVNRPFEQMRERTRVLVGYVALTTVIVSVLAMVLMPLIMPHRDATMFLQEKRAALDAPLPPQETGEDDVPVPEDD